MYLHTSPANKQHGEATATIISYMLEQQEGDIVAMQPGTSLHNFSFPGNTHSTF